MLAAAVDFQGMYVEPVMPLVDSSAMGNGYLLEFLQECLPGQNVCFRGPEDSFRLVLQLEDGFQDGF